MEVKSDVMWTAEMGVPQDLPPDEMMEQSRRQMELTQRTKTELGSRRLLWATTHGLVGPIGDGYGLLARGRAGDASGELAEGEPLIVHGDFELQTHCRYSEGSGTFGFGMHPEDRSGDAEPGPLRFSLTAGPPAGPSIGLEDGTYEAHFNYDESVGDGTVPSYMGDAEMTLRVAGETDRGPPVVEVEARGDDDGIRFELAGRCEAQLWS